MANVLDLRRRIRSVKNTRQITKAMKMVSGLAELRLGGAGACAVARPYAVDDYERALVVAAPRRSLRRKKAHELNEVEDKGNGHYHLLIWTGCAASSPASWRKPAARSTPSWNR